MKKPPKRYALSSYSVGRKWFEQVDFDYLASLTPEELDFLEKFSQEYYRNAFKNNESDLHPAKTDARRARYNATNARNRDIWNMCYRTDQNVTAMLDPEMDDGEDE